MEEKAIKETMEGPVTTTTIINQAITEAAAAMVAREGASSVA